MGKEKKKKKILKNTKIFCLYDFFLRRRKKSRGGGGEWIQTLNRSPGYDLGGGISMGHTRFINVGFSLRTKMA